MFVIINGSNLIIRCGSRAQNQWQQAKQQATSNKQQQQHTSNKIEKKREKETK